jgi:predicted metal-dependent hydrolase
VKRGRRRSARRPVIRFPGGTGILQRIYTRLGCQGRPPRFVAEFFPYANLTHTIRLREDTAYVRFSDLLRHAPREILEAAAAVLLASLYRRPVPRQLVRSYRQFALSTRMRRRVSDVRRARARKLEHRPRGHHHDLAQLYAQLNHRYFEGRLSRPRLAWSPRPWRRQLGLFDPALGQIVISSRLDRARVPRFAVEYVLYHEMLHVKHPQRRSRCGLESHSAKFRRQEQQFPHYARARRFLERLT